MLSVDIQTLKKCRLSSSVHLFQIFVWYTAVGLLKSPCIPNYHRLITAVSIIERLRLYEVTLWGRDLVSVVRIKESPYYRGFFFKKMYENFVVACVASVSVWFPSKERPRNRILGFGGARNETRPKKWKWGEGEGKEGNAYRQTPRFWKPAFASERSAWLARLVEQCWHVSIRGLFHTERTVW